jgi:hypothetical protein
MMIALPHGFLVEQLEAPFLLQFSSSLVGNFEVAGIDRQGKSCFSILDQVNGEGWVVLAVEVGDERIAECSLGVEERFDFRYGFLEESVLEQWF